MKLWFPAQPWCSGVGDHLLRAAVAPAFMKLNPGAEVVFAIETAPGEAITHWPGVIYRPKTREEDFVHAWNASPYGGLDNIYKHFGIPIEKKRLYYFTTEPERAYAELVWGEERPRVVLQLNGGMPIKQYGYWPFVIEALLSAGVNLILLDGRGEAGPDPRYRTVRHGNLRNALAIVAAADLFIGWDSGPFYAALGSMVPSIALFPSHKAYELFQPIVGPTHFALECHGAPNAVPPNDIVDLAESFLSL